YRSGGTIGVRPPNTGMPAAWQVLAAWHLALEICEQHRHGARPRAIAVAGNGWRLLPIDDVLRRVEEGVDPATPRHSPTGGDRRKLEFEQLPVRVEDDVQGHSIDRGLRRERDAVQ